MLCAECAKRKGCKEPCQELEQELERLEGEYQPDAMVSLDGLSEFNEGYSGIFPDSPLYLLTEMIDLNSMVSSLGELERAVIQGYFWEGKSLRVLSEEMKIPRREVFRIMKGGIKVLRKDIRKMLKSKGLSFLEKFGYNKKELDE